MKVTLINSLNNTYQQESKKIKDKSKEDLLKESYENIKNILEGTDFKSEEEKIAYEKKLNEKIKMGAELSKGEMSYLQRTNPMMYMRIKRVQMQREMLKIKLKQCKSKKEVEETYNQAMSMISDKDPDKELVISAYQNVVKEFKKTKEYKSLPYEVKEEDRDKKEQEIQLITKLKKFKEEMTFDMTV
jgi:hypothetical protein